MILPSIYKAVFSIWDHWDPLCHYKVLWYKETYMPVTINVGINFLCFQIFYNYKLVYMLNACETQKNDIWIFI